ncbi:MAG TPA: hypothetical protein VED83_08265 [Burkholderiaceae bacterium]|nr:hypothetical protein [Burkholderiaceae bacterium]
MTGLSTFRDPNLTMRLPLMAEAGAFCYISSGPIKEVAHGDSLVI